MPKNKLTIRSPFQVIGQSPRTVFVCKATGALCGYATPLARNSAKGRGRASRVWYALPPTSFVNHLWPPYLRTITLLPRDDPPKRAKRKWFQTRFDVRSRQRGIIEL